MNKIEDDILEIYNNFEKQKVKKRVKSVGRVTYTDEDGVITTPESISFIENELLEDKELFIKIYVRGIGDLHNLSITAKNLLNSIYHACALSENINKCLIYLSYDFVSKECGYNASRSNYNKGLKELKDKNIVTLKHTNLYLYNPKYFFNGNRVTFIKNFVLGDLQENVGKK